MEANSVSVRRVPSLVRMCSFKWLWPYRLGSQGSLQPGKWGLAGPCLSSCFAEVLEWHATQCLSHCIYKRRVPLERSPHQSMAVLFCILFGELRTMKGEGATKVASWRAFWLTIYTYIYTYAYMYIYTHTYTHYIYTRDIEPKVSRVLGKLSST